MAKAVDEGKDWKQIKKNERKHNQVIGLNGVGPGQGILDSWIVEFQIQIGDIARIDQSRMLRLIYNHSSHAFIKVLPFYARYDFHC
jgi:hypothetical protein